MIKVSSRTYNKILIINPFGIGDVLFSTALLRNLHEAYPQAQIYYMCNKRVAPFIMHHPLLAKVFIYERDDFENIRKKSIFRYVGAMKSFLDEIRGEHIDCALDLSLNTKFGFYAWYAGIKKRIGFDFKKRGRFLTKKIPIDGYTTKHVAEYYLDLLRSIDVPIRYRKLELFLDENEKKWLREYFQERGVRPEEKYICMAPCGGESFGPKAFIKRWPGEYFAELINRIHENKKYHIFLLAGPKEKKEIADIISKTQHKAYVHDTTDLSLQHIAALIEKSTLVISNDTGPLRFADAFGKKIIAFFGPVDDTVYGLYPHIKGRQFIMKKDLECQPCYKQFRLAECERDYACLRDITVDEVFEKVAELLTSEE